MDGASDNLYNQFVALHRSQLLAIPAIFWNTLYRKLSNSIFDAGSSFSLLLIDYGDEERTEFDPVWTVSVSKQGGIKSDDPNEIYLIDHAWTFKVDQCRRQLNNYPELAQRMAILMGICKDDVDFIDKIMDSLWRYCHTYSIQTGETTDENRMPIWYVMDELGSGINHSNDPNFRVVLFVHLPEGITYSILFPVRSCSDNEQITRDYVEHAIGNSNSNIRNALLLPWKFTSFIDEDFTQKEPDEIYFSDGHIQEIMPVTDVAEPVIDPNRPLKVYAEYSVICQYLTDPAFELVDNEDEADILWLIRHFKNFAEMCESNPNKFINQFPYEYVITIKDLLSVICRRRSLKHHIEDNLTTMPKWLPATFNLKTELPQFVSYFQNRSEKGLDNHWIIKPWNLARGLDTTITKNLSHILRLPQTGPKIAQKYVENPVLFDRPEIDAKVKFDIRYVVLLKRVEPLEAYVYSNFFLRFANKEFELNNFDDYEKHFTVMNYNQSVNLRHIRCAEFLESWKIQYPEFEWDQIEHEIISMLNEVFLCAKQKKSPCGIVHLPQSRALYAADIILAWENGIMQPKLLEINWIPDCKRACDYYPDFFNDIFKLLFLDDCNDDVFKLITN